MATLQEKIDELSRQISELAAQQTHLGKQLLALMNELDALKKQAAASTPDLTGAKDPVPVKVIEYTETITAPSRKPGNEGSAASQRGATPVGTHSNKSKTSFEEFIGKNLASKVGILVTIVGIFIGARYAIEHNMVSPVVRIINGYVSGLVLIGIALKLKKKYENYSAVLMGGGLCVLYFITYIAWSFYSMLPQMAAFGLMLLFTAAIVYAAILYNRVIIAHLAQVGAYAIPFLLSNNSGQYAVLFTYILIINAGILVLSFYKYWKSLFYVAYIATWLIYAAWYVLDYNNQHFNLALGFLCAYFILFYATFLAYKLIRKEQYNIGDVFLLLSNSFIFYGLGYGLLSDYASTKYWAGLFTVVNALVHLGVSLVVRRLKLADKPLYYMILGLVVVFLTIAVPVQLDGNWVTLLWITEAVLLFSIGRTRGVPAYEQLAAGLTILAFVSMIEDNLRTYYRSSEKPFFNITFFTGLLVTACLGYIVWLNRRPKWSVPATARTQFHAFYDYIVPVFLLIASYFVPFLELTETISDLQINWLEKHFLVFNVAVNFLYAAVYGVLVMFINQRWIRNRLLAAASLTGILILCANLLMATMPAANELSIGYFQDGDKGVWHVAIRYVVIAIMTLVLVMGTRVVRSYVTETMLQKSWWLMVYVALLGTVSYEYVNWTTIVGASDQFRVGLSIVWGLFALALVVYGIRKKKKYIRLAAIVLFVATILKLFVYDLAEAGTITKTVSFISLGAILLLVSYLYNRYKEILFGEDSAEVRP
jgi:uncharacterized membrane protein